MLEKRNTVYQTEFVWSVKVYRIEVTFFRSGMKSRCIAYTGLVLLSNKIAKISACAFKFSESKPPIPVAARFKAWLCNRSLGGITGSNPAGIWYLLWVFCVVQEEASATGPSPFQQRSPTGCACVCVSLSVFRSNNNILHHKWLGRRGKTKRDGKKTRRINFTFCWPCISV
jgi:hypothetical protein